MGEECVHDLVGPAPPLPPLTEAKWNFTLLFALHWVDWVAADPKAVGTRPEWVGPPRILAPLTSILPCLP